MEGLAGVALIAGCILLLWLVRARDGETVPILRSEGAQSTFMMTWIVAAAMGLALALDHLAR